jgi:hypothetical protein
MLLSLSISLFCKEGILVFYYSFFFLGFCFSFNRHFAQKYRTVNILMAQYLRLQTKSLHQIVTVSFSYFTLNAV